MTKAVRHIAFGTASIAVSSLYFACADSPTRPNATTSSPTAPSPISGVRASNAAPVLEVHTSPATSGSTISGLVPLQVALNMCRSSDADSADSLRFDVNWGDGNVTGPGDFGAGTSMGDGGPTTGCDGQDCCRHRHLFEKSGTYTVEVAVTDKHLEDQSNGVATLARATQRITISVNQIEVAPSPVVTLPSLPVGGCVPFGGYYLNFNGGNFLPAPSKEYRNPDCSLDPGPPISINFPVAYAPNGRADALQICLQHGFAATVIVAPLANYECS